MVDTFSNLPEVRSSKEKMASVRRLSLETPQGGRVQINGREVIMLGSNNYLGLANHPKVIERAKRALDELGAGTGINPLLCSTPIHDRLTEVIAEFTNCETALLFSSCMAANIGLVATLMGQNDVVLSEEYNHASIIDACRMSAAKTKVYPHHDMEKLDVILADSTDARLRMIISDGVFSMEGETARLPDMIRLGKKYSAVVVIDEAHAAGVIGSTGRGTAEAHHVLGQVDIQTGTFSKAFGACGGGYIAGSKSLIDFLYDRARFFIFTNGISPVMAACALAAVEVFQEDSGLHQKLWENTRQLRRGLEELGYKLVGGEVRSRPS